MEKQDYDVLNVLLAHRNVNWGWMYKRDIENALGLKHNFLIPSFGRLRAQGLVQRRWEPDVSAPPTQPRVQLRVDPAKVPEVQQLLKEFEREHH